MLIWIALKRTGVPFYEIKTTIESIAGKVILFVDACHSGNVMGGRRGGIDITGVINELISAEKRGCCICILNWKTILT
jgi:hypothetical protein